MEWELIRQKKKTQPNKDSIRENRNQVDHDYKVGDKVMIHKHTAHKYGTPYTGPFVMKRCFTNDTVNLKCDAIQIKNNIHWINPYKSDTNFEDMNPKNMSSDVNIRITSYILLY